MKKLTSLRCRRDPPASILMRLTILRRYKDIATATHMRLNKEALQSNFHIN